MSEPIEKPETITTPADCRALAEHEWAHELADDARALWKGGREQYVSHRAAQHEKRYGIKPVKPARRTIKAEDK